MVLSPSLFLLMACVILLLVMSIAFHSLLSDSIMDLSDGEGWEETIIYAFLAVLAAILFSFVDITVIEGQMSIRLNFTGVLIPIGVVALLLFTRTVRVREVLLVAAIVAATAYPLTEVMMASS